MLLKELKFIGKNKFTSIKMFDAMEVSSLPQVYVISKNSQAVSIAKKTVSPWVAEKIADDKPTFIKADGELAPVFFVLPKNEDDRCKFEGLSDYSLYRDAVGSVVKHWLSYDEVEVIFVDCSKEATEGAIVGINMAQYAYKKVVKQEKQTEYVVSFHKPKKDQEKAVDKANLLSTSINFSRHLVNTPPNKLYPESYAKLAKSIFTGLKNTTVTIWDEKRLEKENMNLMMAVGKASENLPRLIHIKYRPTSSKKPVAFVGKGVTFDSGGLNLKTGAYMRWMKKDMGGSASVFGLAYQLISSGVKTPFDFYLGCVENSIANNAFRPSDIITGHLGTSVEIDNTDAEGRLVLADVLSLASSKSGKDKPSLLIDMATLTGASRVSLGLTVGGMFTNDESIARKIEKESFEVGDPVWLMPQIPALNKPLESTFADTANSGSAMGGAITASVFLEKFVRDTPWVHFDINAWTDEVRGGYAEKGGNGQLVQLMDFYFN